jgi:hypothetical protein
MNHQIIEEDIIFPESQMQDRTGRGGGGGGGEILTHLASRDLLPTFP